MRVRGQWIAGFALALVLGGCVWSARSLGDEWRVTVRGGETELGETPIVTDVSGDMPAGVYQLRPAAGESPVAAQVFELSGKRWLAFVLPGLAASRPAVFTLEVLATPQGKSAAGLSIRNIGEAKLAVDLDGKRLTEYRVDAGSKPIFFPLIGPSRDSYTRAYPMEVIPGEDHDHPHQRSCWFTHGKVNGIDFWSEGGQHGKIKEIERKVVAEGPVLVRLATRNDWLGPNGSRVCSDSRTVTFYCTRESRTIDFEFTIRAPDLPVTFGDTKEGMFGIRVASSMDVTKKTGGRITNAKGLIDEKAWGKASPWVDYVGPVNQKTVGIAVLNHPGSFRYPTTWHVRTYGLFAANPFGWHDFGGPGPGDYVIPTGESIALKYRVILHEGDTAAAKLDRAFSAYAKPPVVLIGGK